jgi:hypothetical protein
LNATNLNTTYQGLEGSLETLIERYLEMKAELLMLRNKVAQLESNSLQSTQILEDSGESNKRNQVDLKIKIEKLAGEIDKIIAGLDA